MEDKKIDSDINLEDSILYKSLSDYVELTEEETRDKIIAYKNSSDENRIKLKKEIIEGNLLLIHNACLDVIKRYPECSCQYDELFSYGAESLINCLNSFDYTKETPFSTYTYSIIRKQIISRMVEIKYNVMQRSNWFDIFNNCRQEIEKITNSSLLDDYTLAYLINEVMYKRYYKSDLHYQENIDRILLTIPISLEEYGDVACKLDIDRILRYEVLKKAIIKALDKLTEIERCIIEKKYGLIDGIEHTTIEISQELNCSHQNVRQAEARALKRLKMPKISKKLKEFY